MLTPRRIEILKAIVDEYIKTAEPVGSKTLQTKYKMPYSSATIRNDMQTLEELGYLEKKHTSSGRVPSTKGYKFYCENLIRDSAMDKKMEVAIVDAFNVSNLNVSEAVHESCNILSEMTNMTTGAIGPDSSTQRLEHIKLFPIDERNTVAVMITNTGHTETKNFHFEEDVSLKDMESCVDVLNHRLKNVPITDLVDAMEQLKPELESQVTRHDILFTAFVQAFVKFASENVYFSGKSRMLYQPEFEDIDKLKKLMNLFDDSSVWRKIGTDDQAVVAQTNGAQISWYNDMAVVQSTFHVNDDESGRLMVVGPSRMNYEQVVSMLEFVAQMIEKSYRNNNGD